MRPVSQEEAEILLNYAHNISPKLIVGPPHPLQVMVDVLFVLNGPIIALILVLSIMLLIMKRRERYTNMEYIVFMKNPMNLVKKKF